MMDRTMGDNGTHQTHDIDTLRSDPNLVNLDGTPDADYNRDKEGGSSDGEGTDAVQIGYQSNQKLMKTPKNDPNMASEFKKQDDDLALNKRFSE